MSFSITRTVSGYTNQFIVHNDLPYADGLLSYNIYDSSKVLIPGATDLSGRDTGPWASEVSATYSAPLCYIECNIDGGGTSPLIPLIVPNIVAPALPVYATAYIRNIPDSGPKVL
jgi:hypothetical protein